MWKCEWRFVWRVVLIWEGVRERRGKPETVPALLMRIVQGPSWDIVLVLTPRERWLDWELCGILLSTYVFLYC